MYTGTTCASFSLFGNFEVAKEMFTSFDKGSEIVLLQNFRIFAGMPSSPVAFLELELEMKVCNTRCVYTLCILSGVMGVGTCVVIIWMLGWFAISSGVSLVPISQATFTEKSFRIIPETEVWSDIILSFSNRMIMGSFRRPLFDRNGFTVARNL